MIIGLVRHFKVDYSTKMFMSSNEFRHWVKEYDKSDVIDNKFDVESIKWDKCYSSDLPRAIKTSKAIFNGKIIKTPLLREVPISPICETNLKLPYVFWFISGRAAWFFEHKSQIETKNDTEKRVNEVLDNMEQNESDNNILIVCHGFFLYAFQKELKKRRFVGKSVKRPKNGKLYLYKKLDS